jgi:hypothetical protein
MVEGQVSDLYASNRDTWPATSTIQASGEEPQWIVAAPLDPILARSYPELCRESIACVMFDVLLSCL